MHYRLPVRRQEHLAHTLVRRAGLTAQDSSFFQQCHHRRNRVRFGEDPVGDLGLANARLQQYGTHQSVLFGGQAVRAEDDVAAAANRKKGAPQTSDYMK